MKTLNPTLKAMTLTELLVVLAILGVLLLLSFPVLKPLFSKRMRLRLKLISSIWLSFKKSTI